MNIFYQFWEEHWQNHSTQGRVANIIMCSQTVSRNPLELLMLFNFNWKIKKEKYQQFKVVKLVISRFRVQYNGFLSFNLTILLNFGESFAIKIFQ